MLDSLRPLCSIFVDSFSSLFIVFPVSRGSCRRVKCAAGVVFLLRPNLTELALFAIDPVRVLL